MKRLIFLLGLIVLISGSFLWWQKFQNKQKPLIDEKNINQIIASPSISSPVEWTMTCVGDIMLSRNVDAVMLKQATKYDYPYLKIKQYFNSDINFVNLETPLIDGPSVPSGTMVFRANIANALAMKSAGINIVSLANNHTPNQSQKGLFSTFSTLEDAGIQYVGAGKNVQEAYSPKLMSLNNFKVAWLAYNDRDVVPESYGAGFYKNGNEWAGTALMNESKLEEEIIQAKSLGQYVIVSMHSGSEYTAEPNQSQKTFAHRAIDAGADLIIGHHPHVVQTVEKYKDKYIFYSLGNFIFDQMFSDETRRGLMLKFSFTANTINQIELIPTVIENYAQPRVANQKEADWVLKRLKYEYTTIDNQYFLSINNL